MPGGGPPGQPPKPLHGAVADVKPRLTKEQHDILESHFQIQHKPSTSTKKGFAESLNVPLDKINNWFQNRRAKVKQDLKKQLNQYNMSMGIYGHNQHSQVPMVNSQYTPSAEQPQPQPQQQSHMVQEYFPSVTGTADISPTCLPVQSVEGSSALDLGSQMPMHQSYDMHALRSIPESGGRGALHPNIMQSILAATEGASYMQNHASSLPQQSAAFQYDLSGLPQTYSNDLAFSLPHTLPNDTPQDSFSGFPDFSTFECSPFPNMATSNAGDVQNSVGTGSSEPSPFSGTQSTATTQSSVGPNTSSVTSITSMYSGWTDEQNIDTKYPAGNECEDVFDTPYNMEQAAASEHALFSWDPSGQGQAFSQSDMYQHTNASAQAILSSPEQTLARKISSGALDFESPPVFGEDMYSRRNSSTTNLANNIEAIHLQNGHTPDGFKQPNPPSNIAARRQKRPTALNSSTLRSASYSGSMPSPGGNNSEHTLRRIRSSGIANASGRIQKASTGSAQRSPMTLTFAEAAASPKFQRALSTSSNTTGGQGGSLAPPTPLTPSERGGYGFWQGNTVIRNHAPMPEHSSPESLNVNWSVEPQSAGIISSGASPPSTPLDHGQLNNMRPPNDHLYRDTPPQSAPATQQTFPRTNLMHPPQMRSGFYSSTDLTIAQPKPSHFRRPSLPAEGHSQVHESQLHYAVPYGDMSLHGITHNVPFAPPAVMPEFLVHEYNPPLRTGLGSFYRHPSEPQPKNYIFANQSPSDFNRP
ncbi:hypothetical protein B0J11DRAFT_429818 [Dendryphion nanum]|uniref:Homeobox domain-containing protein n=1 Tax=Dendryphion nanum TaxID=256645 RepID=A0A9P9E4H7_9PLEO|nr:hypothetical protein B0J11DRAFT_429818 [Dendryphion nanum]